MEEKYNIKRWLYLFSIITLSIIVANLGTAMDFIAASVRALMPIIVGAVIAYVLYIPERKIELILDKTKMKKGKRFLSIIIMYVLLGIIIFAIVKIISPVIVSSATDLISNLPKYYETIEKSELLNNEFGDYLITQIKNIDFSRYLNVETVFTYIKNTISVAKGIFSLFVSIIVSLYLLGGRGRFLQFWKRQARATLSEKRYQKLCKYSTAANNIFAGYLSGQVIDSFIVGCIATIALLILKADYAVLLGVIIGISNLIPFFGAIVGVGFSLIIIALTSGAKNAIIAGIIIIILQQIDANIINPRITSTKIDVTPLVTIIAVTVGGAIFGVLGMFLAVPIAAIIKVILVDKADEKLNAK